MAVSEEAEGKHTEVCKISSIPSVEKEEILLSRADTTTDAQKEAESTLSAFNSVANGKSHVSLNDMLNWDFVLLLIGEVC